MTALFDIIALAGLVTLGVGLWLYAPPLSLSVIGTLLLAGGIVGARRWAS